MIIARILGTVVSTQKDERLQGKKLLIVRPINLDGSDTSGYVVAVDTVGAGFHERVLVVAGSSARLAQNMKDTPVDAAIVGVIDTVVPAYRRRNRRFVSSETAVPDLKEILAKKLPIAIKDSQNGIKPSLSKRTAKRETVA